MLKRMSGKSDLCSIEKLAAAIATSPEKLKAFEESYAKYNADVGTSDNLFKVNAKQAAEMSMAKTSIPDELMSRLVEEVLSQCSVFEYDRTNGICTTKPAREMPKNTVTAAELLQLAPKDRPQFTATMMQTDCGMDMSMIATVFTKWRNANGKAKEHAYHVFRQGLDIMDLNPLSYEIINTNPNSMGYWLPIIVEAVDSEGFFKIPSTKILRMPITMAQMPHLEYMTMTPATKKLINEVCYKAFGLRDDGDYFIKTGTYSSKFDFRNARVKGAKEVRELGEYLLYIHYQALAMAHYDLSGRNQPSMYGASTTNDWVVREFIPDMDGNQEIYHGLPLRTEYRVFVDFDEREVLGISPYWEPTMMTNHFKKRLSGNADADAFHDLTTYTANCPRLTERYDANQETVVRHIQNLLDAGLAMHGQWSIDVMQNGNEFWIIDMADAANSALNHCVPQGKLKHIQHDWIPTLD